MPFKPKLIAFWGSAALFAVGWTWYSYDARNPEHIASILDIPAAPSSLRVVECTSALTTDVLTACAITIKAEEFDQLLKSYDFKATPRSNLSHRASSISVGKNFQTSVEYFVRPQPFTKDGYNRFYGGGYIRILTNSEKDYAVIELYEE